MPKCMNKNIKIKQRVIALFFVSLISCHQIEAPPEIVLQTGHSSEVLSVAFSPDGKYFISGSKDHCIKLWDVKTVTLIRTFSDHSEKVNAVRFSPYGTFIVSASSDNTIKLWDMNSGKLIRSLWAQSSLSICISSDEKWLVSGHSDNRIRLWELKSGKCIKTLSGHSDDVNAVYFSPDAKQIVSGSSDNQIILWNVKTGKPILYLHDPKLNDINQNWAHSNKVNSVVFSNEGSNIVSGSDDKSIKFWCAKTAELKRTIEIHQAAVNSVHISPDGKYIISGGEDNTVRLGKDSQIKTVVQHSNFVNSVSFCPLNNYILSGSSDGTIKLFNLKTEENTTINTFSEHIVSVDYHPEKKYILSSSKNNHIIKLWHATSGELINSFSVKSKYDSPVCCFSPDGQFILSSYKDFTLKLWNMNDFKKVQTYSEHKTPVLSLSFSYDGKYILSGSNDSMKLWKVNTGENIKTYQLHNVHSLSFSRNGKYILSGSSENIYVRDFESGAIVVDISEQSCCACLSPDGYFIISGHSDGMIKHWRSDTNELVRKYYGHTNSITKVAFTSNGKTIISASKDNTIKLWDSKTGQLIRTYANHSSPVRTVCFNSDLTYFISGSEDNMIKIWPKGAIQEKMTICLLPGNEWISYQPNNVVYNASPQGDEWASIRFYNQNDKIYPLAYYRHELKKKNWDRIDPDIKKKIDPKYIKRLWNSISSATLDSFYMFIFIIVLLCVFYQFFVKKRKPSDYINTIKLFFIKSGYSKFKIRVCKSDQQVFIRINPDNGTSYAICCLWSNLSFNIINNECKNLIKQKSCRVKLYIIYTENKPSLKDVVEYLRLKNCDVIPIALKNIEKALFDSHPDLLLKKYEDPYIVRTDPYAETKPVSDPLLFFGRKYHIDSISSMLLKGQHVGVFGLRKMGKTSLVKMLRYHCSHVPGVYISCQAITPETNFSPETDLFFDEILNQLHTDLNALKIRNIPALKRIKRETTFRKQFMLLYDCWLKSGHSEPFIIIIDEIDVLFPGRSSQTNESMHNYLKTFSLLRGIAESYNNLVLLVAGYRPHINRNNHLSCDLPENPMFHSFKEIFIEQLEQEESVALVTETGALQNIQWDDQAVNKVYKYCGGNPRITLLFSSMACQNGNIKNVDINQFESTFVDVIKNFRTNQIGNYFKEGIWDELTTEEKDFLLFICQNDNQIININDFPSKFDEVSTSIEQFGIVRNKNRHFEFTSELFETWLKQRLTREIHHSKTSI